MPRLTWHDTAGDKQRYQFGGVKNDTIVPVKADSRVLVAEGNGGWLATFPPPHTFFFTREVDTNLGYVWYRKDADTSYSFGIRQADKEKWHSTSPTSPCSTRHPARGRRWPSTWATRIYVSTSRLLVCGPESEPSGPTSAIGHSGDRWRRRLAPNATVLANHDNSDAEQAAAARGGARTHSKQEQDVESLNSNLDQQVEELTTLLAVGLTSAGPLDCETLKRKPENPLFQPGKFAVRESRCAENGLC